MRIVNGKQTRTGSVEVTQVMDEHGVARNVRVIDSQTMSQLQSTLA